MILRDLSCDVRLAGSASQLCYFYRGLGGLGHDAILKMLRTRTASINVI